MRMLPVLAVSCFVSSMSMRLVDPVVPDVARDLGVTVAVVALLTSAFAFPYALGQPILGALGDAIGKARIIKFTLAVLTLSLAVTALAPTIETLYAARVVGGAAAGGVIPLAFAMVGDRVPFAGRQLSLSKLLAAIISGQLTGSVGSGLLSDVTDWRVAMIAGAGLSLAALVLTLIFLRPRASAERRPFSVTEAASSYRSVFANPQAWVCFPAVFIEGIVIFGLFPYIAALLEARGAGSVREAGLVLAGFGVGGLVYAALVSRLLPRIGVYRLMSAGGVVSGVALAALVAGSSWQVESAIFVAVGIGFYMLHNSLQTFATELSVTHRGAAVAAHAFFFFLGQAVGPAVYGALLSSLGPDRTMAVAGVMFMVTGAAAAIGLKAVAKRQAAAGQGGAPHV